MKRLFLGLLCAVSLVAYPMLSMADNTITWMEADYPPFLIHEGQFVDQGYGDVATALVIGQLPQYQHKQIGANLSRQYKQFKQGDNVCTMGLYKNPDREEFMYFSIPALFSLPHMIIVNKDKYRELGSKGSVKLQEILQENRLVIGHSDKRSYGKEIDLLLKEYGNDKNLFVYESRGELAANFFEMLKRGRIDAVILSPEDFLYKAEGLGLRDQFISITIEENQHDLDSWFSYVACSKTPWGEKVIADVNKVLVEIRPTDEYRGAYERWIDANGIEGFRKSYKEILLPVTE